MVLAAIALAGGAYILWRRGGSGMQIALMLVLAAVITANIAIWTVPGDEGEVLLDQAPR